MVEAIQRSNGASGGNYVRHGPEEYVVRGIGYLREPHEIAGIALSAVDGVPVTIADVGRVVLGHVPRRGVIGRNGENEAVQGVVLMRARSHPAVVLDGIHEAVQRLNTEVLPHGAAVVPYYDRSSLSRARCTRSRTTCSRGSCSCCSC